MVLSSPYEVLLSSTIGLQLFEWEIGPLKQQAKDAGINDVNIKPLKGVFDDKRKITLVTSWILEAAVCPFLEDATGMCRIHSKTPLMCRAYPLKATGLYDVLSGAPPRMELGACLREKIDPLLNESTPYDKFITIFGNLYWNCFQTEQAKIWIDSLVRQLVSAQYIRPGKIPEQGAELYGLLEFMKLKVLIRPETIEQKLQLFSDVDFAKKYFGELVVKTV